MTRIIIFTLILFNFQLVFGQSKITRIKTEGEILEIKTKANKRYLKHIALIKYTTSEGLELESRVEIFGVPIFGSFRNVGDKIEIYYDKNKPGFIETQTGAMFSQYGLYILILLGVLFSFGSLKKAYSN